MVALTDRGYTGHEHIDLVGIIHMNGRIYDPQLGRFLQADPFIEDSTTLNRYTYVHNNPLSYNDPTGYLSWREGLSAAISIVGGIIIPGAGFTMQGLFTAMATGAAAGAVASGSTEGALWGAFSGAVFYGIGAHFQEIAAANTASDDLVMNTSYDQIWCMT